MIRFLSLPGRLCARAMLIALSVAASSARAADPATPDGQTAATEGSGADAPGADAAEARAPETAATRLNEAGAAHYAAGEHRQALEAFLQAYALERDPNLLFNVASCYERLGDADAAREKYRAFLASPDGDPEGRPRAEQALERLAPGGPSVPTPAGPQPASLPPAPGAPTTTDRPEPGAFDRALPWVTLGGGALISGTGLVLYLLGDRDHARVNGATSTEGASRVSNLTRAQASDLVGSGSTKKALGVTGLVAGGALAATYAVLRLAPWRSGGAADAPQLDALPLDRGALVSWSGSF
jgi:tetratricopeptide (TPR) repeat protein